MKIGIVITSYNRPDYLKKTLKSVSQSNLPDGLSFYLIDDCSKPDVKKIVHEFSIQGHDITKVYNKCNRGMFYGLRKGFEFFYNSDFDFIGNLDSDMVVKPFWMPVLFDILRENPQAIVTGFNTPSHPISESFGKYDVKKSIGGANLIFNRNLFPLIKEVLVNNNWDTSLSTIIGRKECVALASNPSVMEHIGHESIMGHNNVDKADFWLK
jgi:glycosyltransferase involved in cell wall biosynthesis